MWSMSHDCWGWDYHLQCLFTLRFGVFTTYKNTGNKP